MLLFHDNQFLQLLEGPEAAVRNCFGIIARDPRHTGLRVLLTDEVLERSFPDWTMGFERVEDAWNLPRAWSTILKEEVAPSTDHKPASAAKDLLLSFGHGLQNPASAARGA